MGPVAIETLLAFCAACLIVLAIPGPTVIMVIGQALSQGRRVALASVAGVGLGDLCAASLSVLGVGGLLAASATAFAAVKIVGALYLAWIGWKMLRSPVAPTDALGAVSPPGQQAAVGVFRDAFLVTLFNPKGIVFFVAFLPQFIRTDQPYGPQAAVFVAIFVTLGIVNAGFYAILADRAREKLRNPVLLGRVAKAGGLLLMGAAMATLLVRRV
jgi:threonine/homoserine/homoserine lactone efflux protein